MQSASPLSQASVNCGMWLAKITIDAKKAINALFGKVCILGVASGSDFGGLNGERSPLVFFLVLAFFFFRHQEQELVGGQSFQGRNALYFDGILAFRAVMWMVQLFLLVFDGTEDGK